MSLAILFHFLCAQHISDINIYIIRNLWLFCWITTLVVLFLVRCVLEFRCGWFGVVYVSLQHGYHSNPTTPKLMLHASAKNMDSRKLLMIDILMSETCWAHKKWNEIASDIKLVFYSSTITMMHGPINIKFCILSAEGIHVSSVNINTNKNYLLKISISNFLFNIGAGFLDGVGD